MMTNPQLRQRRQNMQQNEDDDCMSAHSRSCYFYRNDVLAHDEEQEEDEPHAFICRITK